jgi:hypothetical protein
MYCKNCGVDIGEDGNFCPKCGFEQKKLLTEGLGKIDKVEYKIEKIQDKTDKIKIKKKINFLTVILIILFLSVIVGLYLMMGETRSVPYQESYQDPVYRTENYQEPVYRTENYQEPIYGTVYSGKVGNRGLTGQTWTINGATSFSKTYTGEGFWGSMYTFNICWRTGTDCRDYYQIQFWDLQPETRITGYETKTRQVFDHNEQK